MTDENAKSRNSSMSSTTSDTVSRPSTRSRNMKITIGVLAALAAVVAVSGYGVSNMSTSKKMVEKETPVSENSGDSYKNAAEVSNVGNGMLTSALYIFQFG